MRQVLITGASRGFGAALAQRLTNDRLILLSRSLDRGSDGRCDRIPVDLSRPDCATALADIQRYIGVPDVIVNNAGSGAFLATDETTREQAESMMAVPYFAAFSVVRAFLPAMIARGSGHIMNVTSAVAFRAIPGAAAYSAACFAMRGFTDALRAEVAGAIDVTLFVAGTSSTPGYEHYPNVEARTPGIMRVVPELTPDRVARAMEHAIEHRPRVAIVPWQLRALLALDETLPTVSDKLVRATGWQRQRERT